MQVYVLLHDGKNILIAKKRVTNAFWKRKWEKSATVVNQAGQWALPGGRVEREKGQGDEKLSDFEIIKSALRELEEETGLRVLMVMNENTKNMERLTLGTVEVPWFLPPNSGGYRVLFLEVSKLASLEASINGNLKPDRNGAPQVYDWELAEVRVVPADEAAAYLGALLQLSEDDQALYAQAVEAAGKLPSPASQLIDWYREIAKSIKDGVPPKPRTK